MIDSNVLILCFSITQCKMFGKEFFLLFMLCQQLNVKFTSTVTVKNHLENNYFNFIYKCSTVNANIGSGFYLSSLISRLTWFFCLKGKGKIYLDF